MVLLGGAEEPDPPLPFSHARVCKHASTIAQAIRRGGQNSALFRPDASVRSGLGRRKRLPGTARAAAVALEDRCGCASRSPNSATTATPTAPRRRVFKALMMEEPWSEDRSLPPWSFTQLGYAAIYHNISQG